MSIQLTYFSAMCEKGFYAHVSAKSLGKIKSPLDSLTLKKGGQEN